MIKQDTLPAGYAKLPNIDIRRAERALAESAVSAVVAETGISRDEILSDQRAWSISRARHMVCHRLYRAGMSYRGISFQLGMERTTVIHAIRRSEKLEVQA